MPIDSIISVLIGLVGACGNNPTTENTDALILKALAASDEDNVGAIVSEIRAEKNRIAPGCATCAAPCGNTSDYDMSRIYDAAEEIRDAKMQLLSELRKTASYICQNKIPLTEQETELFYKALSYIGYDLEKDPFLRLLAEIQKSKNNIKEKAEL